MVEKEKVPEYPEIEIEEKEETTGDMKDPEELEKTLALLQKDADSALQRATKNEKIKENVTAATLEKIRDRRRRVFDILVPIETHFEEMEVEDKNGNLVMGSVPVSVDKLKFVVRRPTDKERLDLMGYTQQQISELSIEEREKIDQNLYEFLASIIVEPKEITAEFIQEEFDQPMLTYLVQRVVAIAMNVDDGKIVDFFTK